MERAKREMSFGEEFVYLKEEFEKVIESEDPHSEPKFVNCVLRRAMRCIRKQGEELQAYKDLEEQGLLLKEEDVLKFYYCESEDKYLIGQRVDTMYYAEVGKAGLCFIMSRYLPWGERVVAPHTVWKEHTYPSEPKEIPFFDWLQGYIKQLNSKAEAEKALADLEPTKEDFEMQRKAYRLIVERLSE